MPSETNACEVPGEPIDSFQVAHKRSWPWVLCLIGLDYFSTLAYLPTVAHAAVGPYAPFASLLVVAVTLLIALPLYCYVVGRSPHGRGVTAMLERLVHGWRGKLLILVILGFVATDLVVTRSLSVSDAAHHIIQNPAFHQLSDEIQQHSMHPSRWSESPNWRRFVQFFNEQLVLSMLMSMMMFAYWHYWRKGSTKLFTRTAALVVGGFLFLTAIIIVAGLFYLENDGAKLVTDWRGEWQFDPRLEDQPTSFFPTWVRIALFVLMAFPQLALGLSGFEITLAVVPLIRGKRNDDPNSPKGRITAARRLMITSALIMCLFMAGTVWISTLLIPGVEQHGEGKATYRTLAYLAHGGMMANGLTASHMCPLFGPLFGTVYDAFAVSILCLAGACVTIGLRDLVPAYLVRYGMESEWAHRVGVILHLFNAIIMVVTVVFKASVSSLQWAYATSVLALLASAALAGMLDARKQFADFLRRMFFVPPMAFSLLFFLTMTCMTIVLNQSGVKIAIWFVAAILVTSAYSRWLRSTELRFKGLAFADEATRTEWERMLQLPAKVLIPHRPGVYTVPQKLEVARRRNRLPDDMPIFFVEVHLGDTSNFYQSPLLKIDIENGLTILRVSSCVSISHVIAAIGLEMSKTGKPTEIHFGWSDESPIAANLNFLLFGEGNVPWMVRALTRRAEPNSLLRPRVIVG